jgi:hypothetical protein
VTVAQNSPIRHQPLSLNHAIMPSRLECWRAIGCNAGRPKGDTLRLGEHIERVGIAPS